MYAQTILKQKTTSVSVGICATIEVNSTLLLVNQLMEVQDASMQLQQIIVATPNEEIAGKLVGTNSRIVVLLEKAREGKTSALNKIIEKATGEILVLISADVKLARNSVPKLVKKLAQNETWGAADSKVELVNGDRLLMDRVSNILWEIHNVTLDELDGTDRLGHVAGDLVAVKRELVEPLPDVINDDAYLALRVRARGFRVGRVPDANVWIAGPRTPTDYIYQRSRVLRGHLQLIRLFGKAPSTFEFQVLPKPRKYLTFLVKTVVKLGPSHLLPLLVAGLLELLSFEIAVVSSLTKRPGPPWRIVETTKQV